jgi:predicted amidophosphoribosyltransferase
MKCCNCPKELSDSECYICEICNREIDRRADETMGNQEEEDGNGEEA